MVMSKNKKVLLSVAGMACAALFAVSRHGEPKMLFNPLESADKADRGGRALQAYNQGDYSITIPAFYDAISDIWDPVVTQHVPYFWYIPKAGGSTLSKILAHCLGCVTCSSMGVEEPQGYVTTNVHEDGGKYLNMNPGTYAGLDRIRNMNVIPSRHDEFILITQHLKLGAELMNNVNQGRLFTMVRHPVKRVIDQFYYRQRATWEEDWDASLASMSLAEYAYSDRWVTNFMVRALNDHVTEDITDQHIEIAKEVLRRKFVVGIMEWYDQSVARFENYFGWWAEMNVMTNSSLNNCHYETILNGDHIGQHPKIDDTGETWGVIAFRNYADISLYAYAKALFEEQAALVPSLG